MKDYFIDLYYEDYDKHRNRKRNHYKNLTREERACNLGNIICPKCGYQNKKYYIKKYGKCNLCGITLDIDYFKREILKKIKR